MNEWKERGACFGSDSNVFFSDLTVTQARTICERCTVLKDCLAYVKERNPPEGVWAGMTYEERRRLFPRTRTGVVPIRYKQFS